MVAAPTWLRHGLKNLATVDARSLAVLRIAMAMVLLVDLAARTPVIARYYSDWGVLTTYFGIVAQPESLKISYLLGLPTPLEAKAFFGLAAIAYVGLLLGFRTRLFTFLSLLASLSIHHRNFMVSHIGDQMIDCLLAWMVFLPTGRRFSIDAAATIDRGSDRSDNTVCSVAAFALIFQLSMIFVLDGINKSGSSWSSGRALHDILWLDSMVRSPAPWLREHLPVGMGALLTHAIVWIEIGVGLALLVPVRAVRSWAATILGGFVLLGALVVNLGVAPWALAAGLATLVSDRAWRATPAPGPSRPRGRLAMLAQLPAAACLVATVAAMAGNNPGLPKWVQASPPKWTRLWTDPLQVHQGWSLFGPDPPRQDGAFVVIGIRRDGTRWDPLTDAPPLQALSAARGDERTILDVSYDARLRLGWFATVRTEVERFVWNGHLLADDPKTARIEEFEAFIVQRPHPEPGDATPGDETWTRVASGQRPTVAAPVVSESASATR